ncbi:hypothetical protein R6Q57_009741 [Mikania cordata]
MSSSQRTLKRKSHLPVADNVANTGCSSSIMQSSITLLPDSTIQRPCSRANKRQSLISNIISPYRVEMVGTMETPSNEKSTTTPSWYIRCCNYSFIFLLEFVSYM